MVIMRGKIYFVNSLTHYLFAHIVFHIEYANGAREVTAALDRAVEISRDRDIDLNNVDVLPVAQPLPLKMAMLEKHRIREDLGEMVIGDNSDTAVLDIYCLTQMLAANPSNTMYATLLGEAMVRNFTVYFDGVEL